MSHCPIARLRRLRGCVVPDRGARDIKRLLPVTGGSSIYSNPTMSKGMRSTVPTEGNRAVRAPRAAGESKADISRDRVLAGAARIFADRGYAGTTMRAVAQHVGLQAGSLYYHYRSKEELIEAVLAKALNGVTDSVSRALAELPAGTSHVERIRTAIHSHVRSVLTVGDYALASRRVLTQVPDHVRRRHVRLRDAYGQLWLDLLEDAQQSGALRPGADTHLARTFILGALNSILEWYRPQGRSIEELAEEFFLLITEGLFNRDSAAPGVRPRARARG